MTRLHLVRHGRAAAGWGTDPDPGLDDVGRSQAEQVADRLALMGPLAVVTSPLLRCQETSRPLCERWDVAATVEPLVAEIPSPSGMAVVDRVEWLRIAMAGTWGALGAPFVGFRDRVVSALLALPEDTVVFSHFVAINAAIGAAIADDRMVIRRLYNCSVTVFDVVDGSLRLVEAGDEADTLIR